MLQAQYKPRQAFSIAIKLSYASDEVSDYQSSPRLQYMVEGPTNMSNGLPRITYDSQTLQEFDELSS